MQAQLLMGELQCPQFSIAATSPPSLMEAKTLPIYAYPVNV
jgi:hypothetical protein